MSTMKTWRANSASSKNTELLAANLARNFLGGEVIELVGDLGSGKTTFVRGLAKGLGSMDHVSSPTFKISNEYSGKKIKILHFDFYRLDEPGLMNDELAEVIGDPLVVVIVEWADVIRGVLPANRLTITLLHKSETSRRISFTYPESLSYLMEGLAQ